MMKAKTKTRLITILNTLLGVVFAIIMGTTYCATAFTKTGSTDPSSVATYTGNQTWVVINGTASSPIMFGEGAHNTEVAIEYSMCYDFDIRVKYSLAWSNGASTKNVILNYANRDAYIVDYTYTTDSEGNPVEYGYLYYKETIPAGHSTLKLFTGVDFVDPYDQTYNGATLTIDVKEVKVYKKGTSYTSTHKLYVDSIAGKAWENYKTAGGDAQVIVYNYRPDAESGIVYPDGATAYNGTTALYGNRYYSGVGLYVIAGATDIEIKAQAIGSWIKTDSATGTAFDNNVKYNYNSDWTRDTADTQFFKPATYNYIIPANSACYIELLDNVEITSVMNTQGTDYTGHRLTTGVIVNGVTVKSLRISSIPITTADTTAITYRPTSTYTIINTTKYNPALYDYGAGAQNFYTNISYTNNTASTQAFTVSFSYIYYIGNGKNAESEWAETATTDSTELTVTSLQTTYTVAPYSTIAICNTYSLSDGFKNDLSSSDAWVEIVPTITTATVSTTMGLSVEATRDGSTLTFSIKNNSNSRIVSPTGSIKYTAIKYDYTAVEFDTNLENATNAFAAQYWNYFYKDANGKYVRATKSTTYQADVTFYTRTLAVGETTSVTWSFSGSALYPNEGIVVGSVNLGTADANTNYMISYSTTGTQSGDLKSTLLNEGTKNTYIVSYITDNYYLRVTADWTAEQIQEDFIDGGDGYFYYMGVTYIGKIIVCPYANSIEFATSYNETWNDESDTVSSTATSATAKAAYQEYFAQE